MRCCKGGRDAVEREKEIVSSQKRRKERKDCDEKFFL